MNGCIIEDSDQCSKEREHGSMKIFDDRTLHGWDHGSVTWKYGTWTKNKSECNMESGWEKRRIF